MTVDLTQLTASEIAARTRAGSLTAGEVAEAFLARIAERDQAVMAWAWLDPEAVRAQARALDARADKGPLHGVPVGVKDVFDTADMPTTYGSALYAGHRPASDAHCVAVLKQAGALVLGKATTVEFAGMGVSPPTRNPHDHDRSPGGSSAGSAAAVGDRQAVLALGTQTAGSTLRPASYCGVHALKPTWGTVSRGGMHPLAPAMDHVTWFGRSVEDLRLLCDVYEIEDAEPKPAPTDVAGMKIGLCRTPWWEEAEPAVRAAIEGAAERLAAAGAEVCDFTLPEEFGDLRAMASDLTIEDARIAFLHEWRARGAELSAVLRGMYETKPANPARLARATEAAGLVRSAFDRAARGWDAILTPSATGEAPVFGTGGSPIFNHFWTLLHAPTVNLPLFTGPSGLPIGMTVAGPRFTDRATLDAAAAIEAALG